MVYKYYNEAGFLTDELCNYFYTSHTHTGDSAFAEGRALVKSGGKWGFIDKAGKEMTSFIYQSACPFREGLAQVATGGKTGFIDRTGNEVVPLRYDEADDFSEGLASVKTDNKCSFIDKTGVEVIKLGYENYSQCPDFVDGLAGMTDISRPDSRNSGFVDYWGREYWEP